MMGGRLGLPAICHNTFPVLNRKTEFDSPGLELPKYPAKFYLKVTNDVTGRVKDQIIDYLSLLASPGKAAVSNQNKADKNGMDRVWDIFKYPCKPSVTLCQIKIIQGREVKKAKLKFWLCVVWYMCLGRIFVENVKRTQEHLLNDPNWTEIENQKNAEITVNSEKVVFLVIQICKTKPFFLIYQIKCTDFFLFYAQVSFS